jgi:hypothetical protein
MSIVISLLKKFTFLLILYWFSAFSSGFSPNCLKTKFVQSKKLLWLLFSKSESV